MLFVNLNVIISGNNQAAILAVAYLVAIKHQALKEALRLLKFRRPQISINVEYLWQLLHFESAVVLNTRGFLEAEPSPADVQKLLYILQEDCYGKLLGRYHSTPRLCGTVHGSEFYTSLLPGISVQSSIVTVGCASSI